IRSLHYDMQLSFYETAIAQWVHESFGAGYDVESFIIAQKNSAPFHVLGVMKLHPNDLIKGWEKWTTTLQDLVRRQEEDDWLASTEHTVELQVYKEREVTVVFDDPSF